MRLLNRGRPKTASTIPFQSQVYKAYIQQFKKKGLDVKNADMGH